MKTLTSIILSLFLGVLVSGCGNSDPVYEEPVNTGNGGAGGAEEDPESDAGVATDDAVMGGGAAGGGN